MNLESLQKLDADVSALVEHELVSRYGGLVLNHKPCTLHPTPYTPHPTP